MKKALSIILVLTVASSVIAGGYISGSSGRLPAAYVYAFLTSPTNTTVTTAATYYPIAGSFTNDPMVGFVFSVDHIEYTESLGRYFEVDWHAAVQTDDAGRAVHLGIKRNTDAAVGIMGTLCKTAGYAYALSGTCVIFLEQGDEIQIVVTSSADLDLVTFNHLIATIRPMIGG